MTEEEDVMWGTGLVKISLKAIRRNQIEHLAKTAGSVFKELELMDKVDPFLDKNRLFDPKVKRDYKKALYNLVGILYEALEIDKEGTK